MKAAFLLPRDEPRSLLDDPVLFALVLRKALEEQGHRVDLLTPSAAGREGSPWEALGKRVGDAGLPVLGERLGRGAGIQAVLRKRIREGGYDLVEVVWGCGAEFFLPCLEGVPFTARFSGPDLDPGGGGGKAVERVLARFLERTAAGRLQGFSAGSSFLVGMVRKRLRASCLYWVIHPGVDPSEFSFQESSSSRGGGSVLCLLGGEKEERGLFLAETVLPLLEGWEDLSLLVLTGNLDSPAALALTGAVAGAGLGEGRFRLEEAPGAGALPGLLRESPAFVVPSFEEGGLYALLGAMASGKPVLVPGLPWIYEYVRPEIDGLVLPEDDAGAFGAALEMLLEDPGRAAALGENARERVEARFPSHQTARTFNAFWNHAGSLRAKAPPAGESFKLGPENWFQAWWIAGGPPSSVGLEEGPGGRPLLADLSLEEVSFLERVLSRSWWEQGGAWEAPERELLDGVTRIMEEKAGKAQSGGKEKRPRETGLLALPPLDHPLFDVPLADVFIQESWSIRGLDFFLSWLEKEVGRTWFLAEGVLKPAPRRLVVLSARGRPSEVLYRVLRQAYRESSLRESLIGQDRAFFENAQEGGSYREAVERLGLHLPLARPPVFGRARGRKKKSTGEGPFPGVTILVPSFKHERFIEETLKSALGQSYPEVRVLVVDDRSPDGTVDTARSIQDPRLTVEVNEENLGLGRSLLSALPKVETPYVALLNSDDLFHPERTALCVEALEAAPDAALVATELAFADGEGRVLNRGNTPLVEVGPKIRDLVQWYEDEIKGADPPLDRTGLEGLLRHNHLLTSSNIFCRTEYLRKKSFLLEGLLYTVDWSLFLEGAFEGKLLFLDRTLLAYRLHESNTMWFREESRPGYIMEIHRLLSSFFARMARAGKGMDAARLLLESTGGHGEVEGWFLFLAGLGLLPPAGEIPSWLAERIERIGPDKVLLREAVKSGLDWRRIGNVLWEAEMFLPAQTRARACSMEKSAIQGRLGWAEGSREEFKRWAEDETAQRKRLGEENSRLLEELGKARGREAELEEDVKRLRAGLESLERELDGARSRAESLEKELDGARSRAESLEKELRAKEKELEEAGARRAELERTLEASRKRLERLQAEWREERKRLEREIGGWRSRAREIRFREFLEAARVRETHQWQVGSALLDRMRLLGLYKTAQRVLRIGTASAGRASARILGRGNRIILAASDAYPSPREFALALEARVLAGEGLAVDVLCMRKGDGPFFGKRRIVPCDGLLQKRDRAFFSRRNPAGAEELDSLPLTPWERGRLFSFARTARACQAGCVLAAGLGTGAWDAFAAGRLLDVPFGLSLSPWDLFILEKGTDEWKTLLDGASFLVVESTRYKEKLEETAGVGGERILVRGPLPMEASSEVSRDGLFRAALLGTVTSERELLLFPRALARALEMGCSLEIHFLGGPMEDPGGLEAWDFLAEKTEDLGLKENFFFHGDLTLDGAARLLAGADLVLEGRLERAPEGLIFLSAALSGGIHALASEGEGVGDLRGSERLHLYEAGNEKVLGDLLAERVGRGRERAVPSGREGSEGLTAWVTRLKDLIRDGSGR